MEREEAEIVNVLLFQEGKLRGEGMPKKGKSKGKLKY